MTSTIKPQLTALGNQTITLANLASSTGGVGRQSTLIDTSAYELLHVFGKVTLGTPTGTGSIWIYPIKADSTSPAANMATGNAGANDAGITMPSYVAPLDTIATANTANSTYQFDCVFPDPGYAAGIAVVHNTGGNLNANTSMHTIEFVGQNRIAT